MKPSLSIETMFTASATAFDAVALYNNGTIIIRNNDEVIHELNIECEYLALSPGTKFLAYSIGNSVTVRDLKTGETQEHEAAWPFKVHDNGALLHKAQSLIELPKHLTFTSKGFVIANDRQLQLDQEIVDVAHTVVGTFRNFYVSASGLLLTYSGVELQNTRLNITHTFDFGRYVGLLSGTQLYLVDDEAKNFRIDVTSEINAPLLKKYMLPIDTGPNGEGSYHIDGKGVGTPTQIGDFFIHQDAVAKKLYVGGPRIKKNKITERFIGSQFLGELSASEFINAASLMQEIGISWTRNTEASWLKFFDSVDGKIKYIARRPITNSVSWNTMNSAGIVYGKEITIRGNRYIVRLIKGASSDPFDVSAGGYDSVGSHGSEWNRLMYHVSVGNGNRYTSEPNAPGDWARYSDSALGNSYYTVCQERNGNSILLRGNANSVSHYTWAGVTNSYGWRPLLELVGSEMPSQYLGEIDASDFISGSDLATALGVTEGIDSSSGKWLRYYDGNTHKIKMIAKQPIREQVSWSHLNSKNAVAGTPIVIDGMTYTVRLPKGATSNPSDAATGYDHENAYGSEWNHLMYRVAVGNENDIFDSEPLQKQARFTDIDLGITGQFSLCQEVAISEEAVNQIVVRGSQGVSYLSHAGREELLSWRPVLEIGADDYHDLRPMRRFVEQFETINGVPTNQWESYRNSLMYTDVEATGFVEFDAEPDIALTLKWTSTHPSLVPTSISDYNVVSYAEGTHFWWASTDGVNLYANTSTGSGRSQRNYGAISNFTNSSYVNVVVKQTPEFAVMVIANITQVPYTYTGHRLQKNLSLSSVINTPISRQMYNIGDYVYVNRSATQVVRVSSTAHSTLTVSGQLQNFGLGQFGPASNGVISLASSGRSDENYVFTQTTNGTTFSRKDLGLESNATVSYVANALFFAHARGGDYVLYSPTHNYQSGLRKFSNEVEGRSIYRVMYTGGFLVVHQNVQASDSTYGKILTKYIGLPDLGKNTTQVNAAPFYQASMDALDAFPSGWNLLTEGNLQIGRSISARWNDDLVIIDETGRFRLYGV